MTETSQSQMEPSQEQIVAWRADIPRDLAQRAHAGTSFVPEKRAQQEVDDYTSTLISDWRTLVALATTPEKADLLRVEFERYRAGLRQCTIAELQASSRCVSTMIAGPSNFPARRMNKRAETAHKRMSELIEYRKRAIEVIRKKLCPEDRPIMSGDADAVARLEAKIWEAYERRTAMKRVNTEARKAGAAPLHEPWELSNLGANIRRMRDRAEHLKRQQSQAPTTTQAGAVRLEDDPAANRLRLYFPGKPSAEIRERLKRGGWRWAPSMGAWSAYRNETARAAAEAVMGMLALAASQAAMNGLSMGMATSAPQETDATTAEPEDRPC